MPREQRLLLADKLGEFDGLDRERKSAVRALDAKLASLPEDERATYYSVMRRYHLWVRSLSEGQRAELEKAPLETRLAVIKKLQRERKAADAAAPLHLQLADYNTEGPYMLAQQCKIWLKLNAQQQADVAAITNPGTRRQRLNELGKELKIKPVEHPVLTKEEQATLLDKAVKSGGLAGPILKKINDEEKRAKAEKRIVNHYYFYEFPPKNVQPENLLRFEAALPTWIRGPIAIQPPDEARRRLTVLYRLVYPAGSEFTGSAAAVKTTSAPPPVPVPSEKTSGSSSPY